MLHSVSTCLSINISSICISFTSMSKHSGEKPDKIHMSFMKQCTGMAEPFCEFLALPYHLLHSPNATLVSLQM